MCHIWQPLFRFFFNVIASIIAYIHPVYDPKGWNPRILGHEPTALTTRPWHRASLVLDLFRTFLFRQAKTLFVFTIICLFKKTFKFRKLLLLGTV